MKAIITNYRYWILAALATITLAGLLCIPHNSASTIAYITILFGSKLISLVALIIYCLLYTHWEDQGTIPELTEIGKEE